MKKRISVFISYSHDSTDHKDRILELSDQLCAQGIDCLIDQYEESPEEGWIKWMENTIANSTYVLVVCTKGYLDKFNSAKTGGKGVKWEGAIITQEIYDNEGKNEKFIPVVFGIRNVANIPRILKPYTYYDLMDDSIYEKLYRRLTKQQLNKKPAISKLIQFPSSREAESKARRARTETKVLKQSVKGDNNFQIAEMKGNVSIHTHSAPQIRTLPPPGTIGANYLLKEAIKERFAKLAKEREKRINGDVYGVMYNNFKRDFEIKKKEKWTVIWSWAEASADAIIEYLDEKYANTIAGRKENAVNKGTSLPTKGILFKRERELLSQIDLEISSPEIKEALFRYFGVTSHTSLDRLKHWQWVLYLERYIKDLIGED